MQIVVTVSDARVSADPADVLVTYSLGSCIAVAAYDPVARCGGLLHYQLPTSTLDAGRARENPCMFADTGMARLLDGLARHRARITAKIEALSTARGILDTLVGRPLSAAVPPDQVHADHDHLHPNERRHETVAPGRR